MTSQTPFALVRRASGARDGSERGLDREPARGCVELSCHRRTSFVAGWQGAFNSAIEEINGTFVMPNMFARAVRGETPDAAMKWAEGEYKRIFQKHGVSNP